VRWITHLGSSHAASVLERASPALAGAADVAQGLRATAEAVDVLRDAPARSMTPPHLDLIAAGRDLLTELTGLAAQAARLPGGAAAHDLHRLAAAVLPFAEHVPTLAAALDLSVREALADRLMLIPGTTADPRTSSISWVTITMGPRRDGPPAIVLGTERLANTARQLLPAVWHARQELARHAGTVPTATEQAVLDARRHVGAARTELRQALAQRTSSQPGVLSSELPAHPRLSAQPPAGRQR
jgi:Sec-independent protein translocase protein TatA